MIDYTSQDILNYANNLDLTKSGQKDRQALAFRLARAMGTKTVGVKDDTKLGQINLGQVFESFIKADRLNLDYARFSKCNAEDLEYANGSYEIKVTTSANSLSTPLCKAVRTIFVSKNGAVLFSKEQIAEWLELRKSNEYIRVKDGGICFKHKASEFGKPVKWLNDKLGF